MEDVHYYANGVVSHSLGTDFLGGESQARCQVGNFTYSRTSCADGLCIARALCALCKLLCKMLCKTLTPPVHRNASPAQQQGIST